MSIEQAWYASYSANCSSPKCRRLSRLPMREQWEAAIVLAIGIAEGTAGWRSSGTITTTGEQYWLAPDLQPPQRSALAARSPWWLIPRRVALRAQAIHMAAIECEMRRGGGQADGSAIVARLRRWRQSGAWRRHAAQIRTKRSMA